LKAALTSRNEVETVKVQSQGPYEHTVTFDFLKPKGRIHFSRKEIIHLTLGAVMVAAVAISFVGLPGIFANLPLADNILLTGITTTMLVLSFFTHEIAHKITAQKHMLWAEFRLNILGSVLTMISAVPLVFFKIISPGAVMVAGYPTTEEMGKVSISGPTINIAFSTAFLICSTVLAPVLPLGYVAILEFGAYFNAWIAIFNLIPFGILDGLKIFIWDKRLWTLAFTTSVVLLVFSLGYI
jgi:Zn-dependent protease